MTEENIINAVRDKSTTLQKLVEDGLLEKTSTAVLRFLATIGTWICVRSLARIGVGMVHVVNAEVSTEQKVFNPVSQLSGPGEEKIVPTLEDPVELAAVGPRPFVGSSREGSFRDVEGLRYRRGFVWSSQKNFCESPAALATEYASPLASPPAHLLGDPCLQDSLKAMQGHISVATPFNVDSFERILWDHLNQPFVQSVMRGLREGFWPFEDGAWDLLSEEFMENFASEPEDLDAIRAFRDKEVSAGCWSGPLPTTTLLPGMKGSPMFVVWQKEKARVITREMRLGSSTTVLYNAWRSHPERTIITWKSDVESAFLNLPAHPLWQLRQIVFVDGIAYVVRRLVFGNRASPRIWCSVSGLLCWIAVKKLDLTGTHVYMDDFYGWDFADNLISFHGIRRPRRQVLFLIMWDHIKCPYEDRKQLHGTRLKIIGFWVDAGRGLISLSPESITDIISRIQEFLQSPDRRARLKDWQRLAGHLNWMLNVLPWDRPALSELYRKMGGKLHPQAYIFLNREVREELSWQPW